MMKGVWPKVGAASVIGLTLFVIFHQDSRKTVQGHIEAHINKLNTYLSKPTPHRILGGRYDTILDFCGDLCDLNKTIVPGPIVGTVTAKVDCKAIFATDEIDKPSEHPPMKWEQIPPEIQAEYSHYGKVKIDERFLENHLDGGGRTEEFVFTQAEIQAYIDAFLAGTPKDNYGGGSAMINEAVNAVGVLEGKNVLVIGTQQPWVEAVIFTKKPAYVMTLEYGRFRSEYPNHEFVTPGVFRQRYDDGTLPQFDLIFTYSSVEHSGLGRYGDALNPWGDILTIARAWCVSSPTAKLVVGVPTGNADIIQFNAHRIYGPVLYPYLVTNWKFIWSSAGGNVPVNTDGIHQPVYMFQKINH